MKKTREDLSRLTPLQKAVVALRETREQLAAVESLRREPIAVVGLGCRFPGAEGPDAFWDLLRDGVDAIREIPAERFNLERYFDADYEAPGKTYVQAGGFLDQPLDHFDAQFFGISPREAAQMDPQHRLAVEVAWEALENAGIRPDRLAGSKTGVYMGLMNFDYQKFYFNDQSRVDPHSGSGNETSFVSGRISYHLGLQGPSLVASTACSSSLVSVHLACQALRAQDCELALAGGVNAMVHEHGFIALAKMRAASADGRCKTFDASADGYGRGEGCGILVLKRLRDARRAGDRILAVLRGSAVNHDGASGGLTVPNGPAQERLLREAMKSAGIKATDVGYIEAHGTGTPLGDPIEMRALASVLGDDRDAPLQVGSVKTNIGHLESAAGVAGLIKAILVLQNEEIPPHLHLENPNPHIPWDEIPIRVPTERQAWPRGEKPRVAGVNAFGLSGINSHVLIQEAPKVEISPSPPDRPLHLVPFSAKSADALDALARRYVDRLEHDPQPALTDLAYTASVGRAHLPHRVAVQATNLAGLRERLLGFLDRQEPAGWAAGDASSAPQVAFLFSGQGAQRAGMGCTLARFEPVYRRALERCDAVLRPYLGRPLMEVLDPPEGQESLLDQTANTQPALFAVEYALSELWRSWGIEPTWVLGHSVGEYVAACVAGIFSLEDALKVIAERGQLMQSLPEGGAMAAIALPEERLRELMEGREGVSIGALNGASDSVVSGLREPVEELARLASEEGVKTKLLAVSHAFHSMLMDPILDRFEAVVESVERHPARLELISNLSGKAAGDEVLEPSYWRRHVREPVRFGASLQNLAEQGCQVFLEVGPQPVLLGMGRRAVSDPEAVWLPSLRRGRSDEQQMLASLADLYAHGAEVDWQGMWNDAPQRKVALPTYPFERQPYWAREGVPGFQATSQDGPPRDALLGRRLSSPFLDGAVFESTLSPAAPAFLADHRVFERLVAPAAHSLAMVSAAASELFGPSHVLENVIFPQALVIPDDGVATVQLKMGDGPDGAPAFELRGHTVEHAAVEEHGAGHPWSLHAAGSARRMEKLPEARTLPGESGGLEGLEPWGNGAEELHARAASRGLELGPRFRWLGEILRGDGVAWGRLERPEGAAGLDNHLHPGMLDSCFQLLGATVVLPGFDDDDMVAVPIGCAALEVYAAGEAAWCRAELQPSPSGEGDVGKLEIFAADGSPLAGVQGLEVRQVRRENLIPVAYRDDLYEIAWRAQAVPVKADAESAAGETDDDQDAGASWVVATDGQHLGAHLAAVLGEDAGKSVLLSASDLADADGAEALATLLAARLGGRSCRGVVYLQGLDAAPADLLDLAKLNAAQEAGCRGLLLLVQALDRLDAGAPRLWVVTRGAQSELSPGAGDSTVTGLAQSSLLGLGRVIAREHPELWGAAIDLDPALGSGASDGPGPEALEAEARLLRAELVAASGEEVALRGDARHVARLTRADLQPVESLSLRDDASYLLTGGFGELGLKVARWMVENGARHLVLLGRSGARGEAAFQVTELEMMGASIHALAADVADPDSLRGVFSQVRDELPPLAGIIHAAGVLDDGVLLRQDWQRFEKVLAPKVAGAWNLHQLSVEMDHALDFFVLFSSIAGVFGSPGQGNYAAGNAFLDALAAHRRGLGLPGLSLDWGPWAGDGMAALLDDAQQRRWTQSGIEQMEPREGLEILAQLLPQSTPQVLVVALDEPRFAVSPTAAAPLFGEIAKRGPGGGPGAGRSVLDELEKAAPGARREVLADFVRGQILAVMAIDPTTHLEPDQDLFDLGMDSLMTFELRSRLMGALEIDLQTTEMLAEPTPQALTETVLQRLALRDVLETPMDAVEEDEGWEVTTL